jgi:2-polyprenyl-6-methoxyphenol hydroxylase-like FAD-dependent oxidoreductase
MTSPCFGKQAVVGAGMSGLTTARALADYFEQVVVVFERDALPPDTTLTGPEHRSLAMFTRCWPVASVRFTSCFQALKRTSRTPGRCHFVSPSRFAPRCRVTIRSRSAISAGSFIPCPDPLIESTVRQRVQRYANISVCPRCRVRDLIASADSAMVTAIRWENANGNGETLPADLIIDATGRGNLALSLLDSMGRPQPDKTTIEIDIGYATAIFAIPDDAPSDWQGLRTLPKDSESSSGALMYR